MFLSRKNALPFKLQEEIASQNLIGNRKVKNTATQKFMNMIKANTDWTANEILDFFTLLASLLFSTDWVSPSFDILLPSTGLLKLMAGINPLGFLNFKTCVKIYATKKARLNIKTFKKLNLTFRSDSRIK